MNYKEFASDISGYQAAVFHSAEENEEVMQQADVGQIVRQVGKGEFRCDMAVRSIDDTVLFADRFNTASSLMVPPPSGTVGFLFPRTNSGEFHAQGENTGNDKLILLPPGDGADITAPGLFGSEAVGIPTERFQRIAPALCPEAEWPQTSAVIDGDTKLLHTLRDTALELVRRSPTASDERDADALIGAIVAWIGHSRGQLEPARITDGRHRREVAKRAQAFIEANYSESVSVVEICCALGVGLRTVQRSFGEYFGLTMSQYLKVIRLDAAHRDLRAGDPSELSVTTSALRHGFTHLGRFSVDYHARFGETPSATLASIGGKKSHKLQLT